MIKNTSGQYLHFAMISASDGSAITSGTVSGHRSIDGGSQAAVTGTISHKGSGQWELALSQADTDGDSIGFLFTHASGIPVSMQVFTRLANPAVNVAAIDGSAAAATSLKNVLTGVGDELTLTKLRIDGSDEDGAVHITNSGEGMGVLITAEGDGVRVTSDSVGVRMTGVAGGLRAESNTGAGAIFAGGDGQPDILGDIEGNLSGTIGGLETAALAQFVTDDTGEVAAASGSVAELAQGDGGGLDAAGVRDAIGLASANLDAQLDAIPTATENADALLKRDWTAVTGEAARSVLNALRFLRNKWSVSGSTLTVTKENDSTAAWTAELTLDGAADPVTGSDPD